MFFEANSLAHFVQFSRCVLNGMITKTIHAMLNIKLYFKGFLSRYIYIFLQASVTEKWLAFL